MGAQADLPRFLRQNFHVHTYLSPCSREKDRNIPKNIVARAEEVGLEAIGFTDHFFVKRDDVSVPPFYGPVGAEVFDRVERELEGIETELKILRSCEADLVREDVCSIPEAFAERFDYGLVAATHFHLEGTQQPQSTDPQDVADHVTRFFERAVRLPFTDIVAHPFLVGGGVLGDMNRVADRISDARLRELLEFARDRDVAMEMSPGMFSDRIWNDEFPKRLYTMCKETDVRISIGSDSHSLDGLSGAFALLPRIRALNLGEGDFITWEDLRGKA